MTVLTTGLVTMVVIVVFVVFVVVVVQVVIVHVAVTSSNVVCAWRVNTRIAGCKDYRVSYGPLSCIFASISIEPF